eukprot:g37342.t1
MSTEEEEEWAAFGFPPPAGSGQRFQQRGTHSQPSWGASMPSTQNSQSSWGASLPNNTTSSQTSDQWSYDANTYGAQPKPGGAGGDFGGETGEGEGPNLSFYSGGPSDTDSFQQVNQTSHLEYQQQMQPHYNSQHLSSASQNANPSFPTATPSVASNPPNPLMAAFPSNISGTMSPPSSLQEAAMRSMVSGAVASLMPSMFIPSTPASASSTAAPSCNPNDPANFADEPPLLEELGIDFGDILKKTRAIILPTVPLTPDLQEHADLSGPLFFALALGSTLLLTGKLHFGYIYGFGVVGSLVIYLILNLMSPNGIGMERVITILGYCLLPINILSVFNIVINLRTAFGAVASLFCIAWSTFTATRFVELVLKMRAQRWLIAYPILLFYFCFTLLTVY